jgi:hypothetical protein
MTQKQPPLVNHPRTVIAPRINVDIAGGGHAANVVADIARRVDEAIAIHAAVKSNVHLSAAGHDAEMQKRIAAVVMPGLERIWRGIEQDRGQIEGERINIRDVLPKPSAEPVPVQIRSEIRAHLRALSSVATMEILLDPQQPNEIAIAAFEGPPLIANLPPGKYRTVLEVAVERAKPGFLKSLDERATSIEACIAALEMALNDVGAFVQLDSIKQLATAINTNKAALAAARKKAA